MFKTITVFKLPAEWTSTPDAIETALQPQQFMDCGASQEQSQGWTPPRGHANGPLIEAIGGQWILTLMTESKNLPGAVVQEALTKRMQTIELETGRKPGKKEKKEIAEDVRTTLLPQAFTTKSKAFVWIDPNAHTLVIEGSSQKSTDAIVTQLIKAIEGLAIRPLATIQAPGASMSIWLDTQEPPRDFTTDRACVLKASDESKATVTYTKHALDIDEIRAHIATGKTPTQLAMTWKDRVSFVLNDKGTLKNIEVLDVALQDSTSSPADRKDDNFDADVSIVTGELCQLIPALVDALGGPAH